MAYRGGNVHIPYPVPQNFTRHQSATIRPSTINKKRHSGNILIPRGVLQKILQRDRVGAVLVPKVGIEPTRELPHTSLSRARLPVPPLRPISSKLQSLSILSLARNVKYSPVQQPSGRRFPISIPHPTQGIWSIFPGTSVQIRTFNLRFIYLYDSMKPVFP